ncbi:MAG: ABC transporter substrate-binding protein [Clostridiales Family XIII bacterium]|nr:ABC transporter substrate-binding protein [Clostridiales Family XIII bacterium]
MKKSKKRMAMLLAAMFAVTALMLGLAGCGSDKDKGEADGKKPLKVGIVQLVEHPSLDTIRENIVAELEAEGFKDGDTITINYQNAQNEMNNLKTICQSLVADKSDVIVAITTPAAQAAFSETKDIPIIFAAVTDPVAAELVSDLNAPGGNITGTSDRVSAAKIMDLALQITPDIKTIGALYNSSEVNSQSVVADLKDYAQQKGLTVREAAVTNANEIQQAAQSLAGKCDAAFSPIDNTVASAMSVASSEFIKAKIPFYVGADSMVKDGGLATFGINYTVLGAETGKMVGAVLNGEKTEAMPVKLMEDMDTYVNGKTAAAIGVTIPLNVSEMATDLGA